MGKAKLDQLLGTFDRGERGGRKRPLLPLTGQKIPVQVASASFR
jgi:hypothetical protein